MLESHNQSGSPVCADEPVCVPETCDFALFFDVRSSGSVRTPVRPRTLFLSEEKSEQLSQCLGTSSRLALGFFFCSSLVLALIAGATWFLTEVCVRLFGPLPPIAVPSFIVSTLLLAVGSGILEFACGWVRIERQQPFRWSLFVSLLIGMSFVVTQMLGLWALLQDPQLMEQYGLQSGAFAFVVMHGVHFWVALLVLVYVLLRACADRYDHEYSWGVVFCTWFWHGLGIAWLVIVGAYLIAFSAVPNPLDPSPDPWTTSV